MDYSKINQKYGKAKIREIQRFLNGFGLYRGVIDGIYGRHTAYAVMQYQRLHPPLVPDGIIGKRTLSVMFPDKRYAKKVTPTTHGKYDKSVCHAKYPKETRNQKALKKFYGDPSKREPDRELTLMTLPYELKLSWDASIGVNRIFMHRKVIESFQGFFEDIAKEYDYETIQMMGLDQYGGAFNHRKMRGAGRWSTHAYGIALDLDPAHNQLRWHKPRARFSRSIYDKMWKIAAKHGLYSLGVHHNYDYMHIQAAWRR